MKPKGKNRKKNSKQIVDFDSLEQINLNAAGLDIGALEIYVCVPRDRDDRPVQVFKSFTSDLHRLADWLQECGVDTVAMESTGIYWIPLYEILEERGFEVNLVNARQIKNVPGKKTDVLDCQWIQQLHTYGLLRASFRPQEDISVLRSLRRHRDNLFQSRSRHIQHMQKALTLMNVRLTNVVSDITGLTGMKIIRSILGGERDPLKLAEHRHHLCAHSEEEIVQSLVGNYRPEHLFALKQAVDAYDFYNRQIAECDEEIERNYSVIKPKIDERENPLPPSKKSNPSARSANEPSFDLRTYLYRLAGVDLTVIDGINTLTAQTVLTEVGADMSPWPTEKHFTSWLGLCPHNDKSGGRVLKRGTKKTKNRVNTALRMAAQSLHHSNSVLGEFYRRMRAKHGSPSAIVATAHKLARIIYHMLKYQEDYKEPRRAILSREISQANIAKPAAQSQEAWVSISGSDGLIFEETIGIFLEMSPF
jgi:transposase